MDRLAAVTTPEQYRQIEEAVAASGHLKHDLEALAAAGKLTGIQVVQPAALQPVRGAHFNAYVDGTRLVIAAPLLKELSNNLLFDVVKPDDVQPNNTTFVLAHLAHHLRTRDEMHRYEADVRRRLDALPRTAPPFEADAIRNLAAWKHITDESSALIEAWNDVIEDATARHKDRHLTKEQTVTVLLNLRYRAIFLKALKSDRPLAFADDGAIELNNSNVKAVADALVSTQLMDVE